MRFKEKIETNPLLDLEEEERSSPYTKKKMQNMIMIIGNGKIGINLLKNQHLMKIFLMLNLT